MPERADRWFVMIVIIGLVIATTLPYLIAALSAGEEFVFGGFLLNPLDGNTYLAKMYQGWRGDLRFTLPYTADVGKGSFLFMFYLLLGHLTRLIGVPLLFTFHFARVLAIVFMLLALYRFLGTVMPNRSTQRLALIMAAFGAGLGWFALLFGAFTSDFWVAEAYPFLSAYTNPHFPLGLALLLSLLSLMDEKFPEGKNWRFRKRGVLVALAAFSLAIISPFGVVLILLVLSSTAFWECYRSLPGLKNSKYIERSFWIILGGVPLLFYYLWVIKSDPLLKIWDAQNQTPSPPIWDLVVSFSPVLIMAILSIPLFLKKNFSQSRLLIAWVMLGIFLIFIPWSLQRRFMMGLYIPLTALAALWFATILMKKRGNRIITILLILLIIPTNIIILLAAWHGIQTHDATIYLTRGESQAFEWVEKNTPSDAIILSAPETGLFIPAHTGRRVLYGHPYETIDAEQQEALVRRFFQDDLETYDEQALMDIDFIFEGPRERQMGGLPQHLQVQVAYQNQDVVIYRVKW